jgi:hypothetical protein
MAFCVCNYWFSESWLLFVFLGVLFEGRHFQADKISGVHLFYWFYGITSGILSVKEFNAGTGMLNVLFVV